MQYRSIDEGGDLFSILEHQQKLSHRALGINKLNKVMDWEARWAVKNKETHYGYKNHVKVDAKSKLIIAFETTPEAISTKGGFDDGFGGVGVCAGVDGAADCFIGIGGLVAQGH
jgi:hypothetical protein